MKILLGIVIALSVGSACAQTAKVIPLSDKDSEEIKSLYAQQADIQKKIDAFRQRVWRAYTTSPKTADYCPQLSSIGSSVFINADRQDDVRCIKDGWSYGFSYSEDFKYIVPVPVPEYKPNFGGCITPAFGTTNAGSNIGINLGTTP